MSKIVSNKNVIRQSTSHVINRLYATDASIYQQVPAGVAWPKNKAECIELVKHAAANKTSLIPRAAGTSIAGQCVGDGLVVDVSLYMTKILGGVTNDTIRVQSGVILDDLNDTLNVHGLKFAVDISTSNRCMVSGMIGNNAAGSHSILYGTTRDHVEEIEVILSDGSVACFKSLNSAELELKKQQKNLEGKIYRKAFEILDTHRDVILRNYPKPEIIRRNTGYALDYLANLQPWCADGQPFNLAPLIAGSEGTLAFINEALLKLVKKHEHRIIICSHFADLNEAMRAVQVLLDTNPAAVELMDKRILDLSAQNIEQNQNRFWVQGDPAVVLITEYFADSAELAQSKAESLVTTLEKAVCGYAHPIIQAENIAKVWAIRKEGLGSLMGVNSRRKPVAVIEDTAVAVSDLPAYVEDIQSIMRKYDTDCVYYGHASVGVLHLRPELDLSNKKDKKTFNSIAIDVAALVKKYKGSLSAEHGDGRVRGVFLRQMVGEQVYQLHQEIKSVFDPDNIFNPQKILTEVSIDADLRADKPTVKQLKTGFNWDATGGFNRALEKCNGVGACRKSAGRGTMCPTYQATKDEKFSTRGRANLLRFAFSSDHLVKELQEPVLLEALGSCLACKACKSECPSSVDMARLKSEMLYQQYAQFGTPLRARLSAYYPLYLKLASYFPVVANSLQKTTLFRFVIGVEKTVQLPTLAKESASSWWKNRAKHNSEKSVVLLVDVFSHYLEPGVVKSAVCVLEQVGYRVEPVFMNSSPRQLISKGLLNHAREALSDMLKQIDQQKKGVAVIGLEPSELLTLKDEANDLLENNTDQNALKKLVGRSYLFDEFLLDQLSARNRELEEMLGRFRVNAKVYIHTHCHQKSLAAKQLTTRLLQKIPNIYVEELNTGCCGMAGQFGYEQPAFSKKIAETTLLPHLSKLHIGDIVIASGTSCRVQISNMQKKKVIHLAQFLSQTSNS